MADVALWVRFFFKELNLVISRREWMSSPKLVVNPLVSPLFEKLTSVTSFRKVTFSIQELVVS